MSLKGMLLGDHPLWCEALARLLPVQGWQVELTLARSVNEICQQLENDDIDIALLDLSFPEIREAPGLQSLIMSSSQARVVALDERLSHRALQRARSLGMAGYVTKTTASNLLAAQLGVVLAGGLCFPHVAPSECETCEVAWRRKLSPRQREVLELVFQGKSNLEISEALSIKTGTVKLHVHSVLRAAGVRSRTELVARGLAAAA